MLNHCIIQYLIAICVIIVGLQPTQVFSQGSTCADAVNIGAIPYNSPFLSPPTTCGAGNTYLRSDKCGNYYMDGEEYVYKFTPTAANNCISIDLTPGVGESVPTALFVTKGCPDDPNGYCVAQFVNTARDDGLNSLPSSISNLLLDPGETYYIQVTSRSDCYQFSFSVTAGTGCAPPDTGDDCNSAEVIASLPYATTDSTCGNWDYMKEGNVCTSTTYNDGPEYFWTYTPTEEECIKVEGKTTDLTMRFSIYEECPTYSDTACFTSFYFYTFGWYTRYATLTAGVKYYFVMSSSASTAPGCSGFDIKISSIGKIGSVCSDAIPLDSAFVSLPFQTTRCKGDDYNNGDGCANLYFSGEEIIYKYESPGMECISMSANNISATGGLFMLDACPDDPAANCLAFDVGNSWSKPDLSIEYNITNPGTYYFMVGARYSTGVDFDLVFSASSPDPIGVVCETAHSLPSSTSVSAPGISTSCKINDYDNTMSNCGFDLYSGSEYVLTYVAPTTFCGTIVGKNTMGTGGIVLFDDCPNNPAASCYAGTGCEVNCDSIYIDVTFQAGQTYYIVVGATNGGTLFTCDLEIKKSYNTPDGCKPCDTASVACVECYNSDVETGTLNNWTGTYGTYNNPTQNNGLVVDYINSPNSRHTIMNAGGYDPVVGPQLKTTSPEGERYSIRLGNSKVSKQAETITYQMNVTPDNTMFMYYHAVVLQDPGTSHTSDEQPFFSINMKDQAGNEVGCVKYEVRASDSDASFVDEGTFKWKDWSLAVVPLDPYIGQVIDITFTTKDCNLGAHFGYAYIDAFCGNIEIEPSSEVICSGESIVLEAPTGFKDYLWNTGETTQAITINTGGTYTVDIAGYGGACSATFTIYVEEYNYPTAEFYDPTIVCTNEQVEFRDLSTSNDSTSIINWFWDFGDGFQDSIPNPKHQYDLPGIYDAQLVVETSKGCMDTIIRQVNYSNLRLSLDSISHNKCFNDSTGYFNLQVDSGITPFTYQLDGISQDNSQFDQLSAGDYIIFLTDSIGCSDSISLTLRQPDAISASIQSSSIGCNTGSDLGQIQVNGSGGTGSFKYSLDEGPLQTSGLFTDLDSGNYTITVIDSLGCVLDTVATVIKIKNDLTMTVSKTDLICFEDGFGQIVAHANLGQPGYEYSIDGLSYQNDSIFSGLDAGTYLVSVRDANGCIVSEQIELAQAQEIKISTVSSTKAFCNKPTGTMKIGVNPEGNYYYTWFDMPGFTNMTNSDTNNLNNNLYPGNHAVIADNGICKDTLLFTTGSQKSFISGIGLTKAYCDSSNGSARLTINPADGAYSFKWFDGSENSIGPFDDEASNLAMGNYSVIVSDEFCNDTIHFMIEHGGKLSASISDIINPSCGDDNGEASVDVTENTGGTLLYQWYPSGQTTVTASGLASGTHQVTVSDDNCKLVLEAYIGDIGAVTGAVDTIIPTTCNLDNGSVEIIASSGSGIYTYQWYKMPGDILLTGETGVLLSNVSTGNYKAIINDGTCNTTILASINALPIPDSQLISTTPASCGLNNGKISINSNSGVGTHSYSWFKSTNLNAPIASGSSNTLSNLDSGSYSVVVYDTYCSDTLFDVYVPFWEKLSVAISDSSASYCGQNNGSALATVAGGSGIVQYNWFSTPLPGNWMGNGANLSNLSPDCYVVIAEDLSYGCFDTASVCIADNSAPTLTIASLVSSSCNDDNGAACVNVSGGTGNYSFDWFEVADAARASVSSSNCFSPAKPVTYRVIVFDGNCYDSLDITIPNDPAIDINLFDKADEYCEANNGFIEVIASLGTGSYNYSWYQTPDGTSYGNVARIDNISSGNYCVAVFDGQCHDTLCVTIDSLPSPIASISATYASCEKRNGTATASASSGTGIYNYTWYDVMYNLLGSGTNQSGLDSGNYILIVTDNYCSDTVSFFIDMHESPVLVVDQITNAYCNKANGIAQLNVSDGSGIYTFIWPAGINHTDGIDNTFSNELPSGNYCVIVNDDYCSDTLCFTITDPGLMSLSTSSLPDSCLQAKGSAYVSVTGGTLPYTYLWDTGENTASISNKMAGNYLITVTDNNDCQQNNAISIANNRNTISNSSFLDYTPNPAQARDTVVFNAAISENEWLPNTWFNLDGIFDQSSYSSSILYPSSTTDFVCLELMDDNLCLDTLCIDVNVDPNVAIYTPNAFSPNNDINNEYWKPNMTGIVAIEGAIYDRWGKMIFQFKHLHDSWDGTTANGIQAKQDVYAYVLNMTDRYGVIHNRTGSIAIIR
jgi:gliding motility-associated-like protein